MVIYPVFTKWKTRRAVLRGLLLAGAVWAILFGLDRQLPADRWPPWLSTGDWGRCIAAGLVAVPTALIDYGYRNRDERAPWHLVLAVLLVAWAGLLLVFLAPHAGVLLERLRASSAAGGEYARDLVLRVGAPCCFPAALVFALCTRARWRRDNLLGHFRAPLVVAALGLAGGWLAYRSRPEPEVPAFLLLVTAPLLFALLLPLIASLVDGVDGFVFRLPDDPTRAPAEDDAAEPDKRLTESSGERFFSWSKPGPEAPDSEADPAAEAAPKGDLDALADDLFGE